MDQGVFDNSERSITGFVDNMRLSQTRSGIQVTEGVTAPTKTAAGPGHTFSYGMHLPQGDVWMDGYIIAADRFYLLQYVSIDRSELAAFKQMIPSLRLLKLPR